MLITDWQSVFKKVERFSEGLQTKVMFGLVRDSKGGGGLHWVSLQSVL